jgi:hypothetical protein
MADVDGVLVANILNKRTIAEPPADQPPPPRVEKHVRFADDPMDEPMDDLDEIVVGGLIKKNNIYITMLENIKPAIIAGIVVALFQIDLIKSFVGSNISGVFSPDLSIYGFFVFIVIGAVLFWAGHLLIRSDGGD